MSKGQPMRQNHPLAGKAVKLAWTDPECGWQHYRVLRVVDGLMELQGKDDPDGGEYNDGPIWVPLSALAYLEVVDEERRPNFPNGWEKGTARVRNGDLKPIAEEAQVGQIRPLDEGRRTAASRALDRIGIPAYEGDDDEIHIYERVILAVGKFERYCAESERDLSAARRHLSPQPDGRG